jgi:hypothetical protein
MNGLVGFDNLIVNNDPSISTDVMLSRRPSQQRLEIALPIAPELRPMSKPLLKAVALILPREENGERQSLAVSIKMRQDRLSVHGLSSYLSFADRTYGRLLCGSLERYRRGKSQLRLTEAREGSILLILREAIEVFSSPHALALTALVLKLLPDVIKAPSAAYRDYEEGRLRRAERKRLAQRAETIPALQALQSAELRQILNAVLDAFAKESNRVAAVQDFAIRTVVDVQMETTEAPAVPRDSKPSKAHRDAHIEAKSRNRVTKRER